MFYFIYSSHLSQYRCSHWDETVSVLRSDPVKTNTNIFPKFDMLEEGLSCIKMTAKDDNPLFGEFEPEKSATANLTPKQTHVFDWDKSIILDDIDEKPEATINANSTNKDQYCVLSGDISIFFQIRGRGRCTIFATPPNTCQ